MAKMIQFMSETGEKQYPATSSEAVGMSDGSGNLDEKLAELENEIFKLDSKIKLQKGKLLDVNGVLQESSDSYYSDYIAINTNSTYRITTTTRGTRYLGLYNSEKDLIRTILPVLNGSVPAIDTEITTEIVTDNNSSFLIISAHAEIAYIIEEVYLEKKQYEDDTDGIIPYKEKQNAESVCNNQGYYIGLDGSLVGSSGWRYSDFLDLKDYVGCDFYLLGNSKVASISFYTEDNESAIIQSENQVYSSYASESIKDVSTAKYIRICTNITASSEQFVEKKISPFNELRKNCEKNEEDILEIEKELQNVKSSGVIDNRRYVHISFDDTYSLPYDLTKNEDTYNSIFDNPLLAYLKTLHENYGSVFSFYVYNTTQQSSIIQRVDFNITDTTTKFKAEFKENSSWLKFGVHTGISEYESIANAIIAFSSFDNLDRCPRFDGFSSNLFRCKQARDSNGGILGLITSDDERANYYLNDTPTDGVNKAWLNDFMYKHTMGFDTDNQLWFFKSFKRIEDFQTVEYMKTALDALFTTDTNHSFPLIIFTHERCLYNFDKDFDGKGVDGSGAEKDYLIMEKLEYLCQWAKSNGYEFNYPQYNM